MKLFYEKHSSPIHFLIFMFSAVIVSVSLIEAIKLTYIDINNLSNIANVNTANNLEDTSPLPKVNLNDFNVLVAAAAKQHQETIGSDKEVFLNSILELLKDRKTMILEEIKSNPENVLSNSIPANVRAQLPKEAFAFLEKNVELDGTMSVIHNDDFENPANSKFEYNLIGKDRKILRLHFAGKIPDIQTGTKVHIKGIQIENEIAVAGADNNTGGGLTVVSAATVATTNNVLFILANFYDKKEEKLTPEQVLSVALTIPTSTKAFYNANSGGIVDFTGDSVGWYTLDSISYSSCTYNDIANAANAKATAAGVDLTKYGRIVYVLPTNSCANALGSLGGNPSMAWVSVSYFPPIMNTLSILNHELGHNLGVHHANRINCKDRQISDYTNCSQYEYGDTSDVMGNGNASLYFNAPHQIAVNWLGSNSVQTVTTSGRYTISPIESGSGIRALKIAKPNTSESYYISYRQPIGFIETTYVTSMLLKYSKGVSVHVWNNNPITQTKLIELTPDDNNTSNDTLFDGTSFGDPTNGVKITQISHSTTSAVVDVEIGTYTDTISPSTALYPPVNYPNAGLVLSKIYLSSLNGTNLQIKASDDVGVNKVELYKNDALYGSDTTSPYSIALDIATEPDNTAINVQAKAYDAAGNIGLSSTSTVIVDNTIPNSIINSPLNNATVSGVVSINIGATDNIGLHYSHLLIDGKVKSSISHSLQKSITKSISWDTTPLVDGQHTIQIITYDLAANVFASPIIIVNTQNSNIDGEIPIVNITTPTNNATVSGTQTINTSSTDDFSLAKVEIWKDGSLFLTPHTFTNQVLLSSNDTFSWDTKTETNGSHTLQAKAYDTSGKVGISPLLTINVNNTINDTQAPSTPTNLSGIAISENQIDLSWSPSTDNVGVAGYRIFMNGVKIKDVGPSILKNSVTGLKSATEYSFTISAYDAANNFSPQSTPIKTTTAADITPPTISITSPTSGTTLKGKSNLNVSVSAADQNGINSINIYADNNLLQTCYLTTTCSYTWSGKNITAGSHTITAVAFDASTNKNQSTTSSTITK